MKDVKQTCPQCCTPFLLTGCLLFSVHSNPSSSPLPTHSRLLPKSLPQLQNASLPPSSHASSGPLPTSPPQQKAARLARVASHYLAHNMNESTSEPYHLPLTEHLTGKRCPFSLSRMEWGRVGFEQIPRENRKAGTTSSKTLLNFLLFIRYNW